MVVQLTGTDEHGTLACCSGEDASRKVDCFTRPSGVNKVPEAASIAISEACSVVLDGCAPGKLTEGSKKNAKYYSTNSHRKALVTTLSIVGTYIFFYMPSVIFLTLTCDACPFPLGSIPPRTKFFIALTVNLLFVSKGVLDPFIYLFRYKEVKDALERLFNFSCCKRWSHIKLSFIRTSRQLICVTSFVSFTIHPALFPVCNWLIFTLATQLISSASALPPPLSLSPSSPVPHYSHESSISENVNTHTHTHTSQADSIDFTRQQIFLPDALFICFPVDQLFPLSPSLVPLMIRLFSFCSILPLFLLTQTPRASAALASIKIYWPSSETNCLEITRLCRVFHEMKWSLVPREGLNRQC